MAPATAVDWDSRLPGLPRYARVNTLLRSMGAVRSELAETGHVLVDGHMQRRLGQRHLHGRACKLDMHVPDLIVFQPKGKSDISRVPMVVRGELVVQQKASCFPALALAPPPGATVIDGCSAPGQKTSHLAALMEGQGRLLAFEQDERRFMLLKQMLKQKGAVCAEAVHANFLKVDPTAAEYCDVTHVLLDPSCSSSGMSLNPITDPDALHELADLQQRLILHAMRFPSLEALVYSTCSVNDMENECVVEAVLSAQSKFVLEPALPWWHRRGHVLSDLNPLHQHIARCCVRCKYPEDGTIGFFVARFVLKAREGELTPNASLEEKFERLRRARVQQERWQRRQAQMRTQVQAEAGIGAEVVGAWVGRADSAGDEAEVEAGGAEHQVRREVASQEYQAQKKRRAAGSGVEPACSQSAAAGTLDSTEGCLKAGALTSASPAAVLRPDVCGSAPTTNRAEQSVPQWRRERDARKAQHKGSATTTAAVQHDGDNKARPESANGEDCSIAAKAPRGGLSDSMEGRAHAKQVSSQVRHQDEGRTSCANGQTSTVARSGPKPTKKKRRN